jgi:hypothetical protein
MTIYAYTENGPYPAYVNLTELPGGGARLTVRERGHGGNKSAVIDLDDRVLLALAWQIIAQIEPPGATK